VDSATSKHLDRIGILRLAQNHYGVNITVRFPLNQAEKQQLAQILGCSVQELRGKLEEIGVAALSEYTEMFLGRKVFTRGSDMREFRLFSLIKRRYNDRLPTEDEVSALFQTTSSQSRSLLRAVVSKYQYELTEVIEAALKGAVASIAQEPGAQAGADWYLDAQSEYVVEALNHRIAATDPSLGRLTREQGTASRYVVRPATRGALKAALGMP
jgi:hypothetical protein